MTSQTPGTGRPFVVSCKTPPEARIPLRRALVSVYDKTGLRELALTLAEAGVTIVSTGSTAKHIRDAGVAVTEVSELTGFPECLDGRVKTLHPRVHAGILADRRKTDHRTQLRELEIEPFDLVVCNLYPFAETVASGAEPDAVVEQIDIGGPSMVRAAAKNHASVAVLTSPDDYGLLIEATRSGGFTLTERRVLASRAFAHTAAYDAAVATWMCQYAAGTLAAQAGTAAGEVEAEANALPAFLGEAWERRAALRYGENPHQAAALYTRPGVAPSGLAGARQLHGKPMSYNNYQDADAALRAAYDQSGPAVAVCKHANPCGVAVGTDIAEAHRKAHACDPVSAFGGVVAATAPVTKEMAEQLRPVFTEVVVAPGFEPEALEILQAKKNIRLLEVDSPTDAERHGLELRQISGGLLAQERDAIDAPGDSMSSWTLVAGSVPEREVLADLVFAWRAVRSVKSNAILLAADGASVGIGMGQVNRVDSCRLAVERANTLGVAVESDVDGAGGAENTPGLAAPERARGAVAASDAFFPFPDGLQVLIDAGVRAIVQPGGSIRDEEVIAAAEEAGITMYVTGTRHFAH